MHPTYKTQYRVGNWRAYERALISRGDVTLWLSPEARADRRSSSGWFGISMLSLQTPTHELWLSANLTAWHFRRSGGRWTERDTSEPMAVVLSRLFSEKLNSAVKLEL